MMRRLLLIEPVWLFALFPLVTFPGRLIPLNMHWLIVAALFVFWPMRLLTTRRISIATPVNLCIALFLLWLPVSLWASIDRAHSWEVVGYTLFGVTLALALVNHPVTQERPQWIAWALLAMGAALSLLGPFLLSEASIASRLLAPLLVAGGPALARLGETINPNILANALVVILPIATALTLRWDWARHWWPPLLMGLLTVWFIILIVLTESRGSVLAIAIYAPILFMLRWPRLIYLLPVLLAAVIVGIRLAGPDFLNQLASSTAVGGLAERIEIWQRSLYAIHDFSFTGVGLGMFNRVIPLLYPYFLIPPSVDIPDAHNILLQVGVDLGAPGLIVFVAMLLCLFAMLIRLLRQREAALVWALSAGLLGSSIALLVGGLFAAVNWGVKLAFVNWLLIALAVLLHRKVYEKTT
jgi:putative inorganic carbon (HCO3(-)) transporter